MGKIPPPPWGDEGGGAAPLDTAFLPPRSESRSPQRSASAAASASPSVECSVSGDVSSRALSLSLGPADGARWVVSASPKRLRLLPSAVVAGSAFSSGQLGVKRQAPRKHSSPAQVDSGLAVCSGSSVGSGWPVAGDMLPSQCPPRSGMQAAAPPLFSLEPRGNFCCGRLCRSPAYFLSRLGYRWQEWRGRCSLSDPVFTAADSSVIVGVNPSNRIERT